MGRAATCARGHGGAPRANQEVLNALKGVDSRPLLHGLAEGQCVSYVATSGAVPIGN